MVVDHSMPYSCTIALLFYYQSFYLIAVDSGRDSISVEPLIHWVLPTVLACWFGIEKVSVITRTILLTNLTWVHFHKIYA